MAMRSGHWLLLRLQRLEQHTWLRRMLRRQLVQLQLLVLLLRLPWLLWLVVVEPVVLQADAVHEAGARKCGCLLAGTEVDVHRGDVALLRERA